MKRNMVRVLDCTLRDGGYINNWNFGDSTTTYVLAKLAQARLDIVECGYLNQHKGGAPGSTLYATMEQVNQRIPQEKDGVQYAAMIDYGTFDLENLPPAEESRLDYLRICFAKKNREPALEYAKTAMEKGYAVFIQPMTTILYTDAELLDFLAKVDRLKPAAVYFVDSFGVMKTNDINRLFFLYDNNLAEEIVVGYHSHNNLQLAYSNAMSLMGIPTKRELIVDASVFGMGRGAGNLNTELFLDYMNENRGGSYSIQPLLEIMDEELARIYERNYWGYSLPHYLSAVNNCHPNYATYLAGKNTLTTQNIDMLLQRLPEDDKIRFSAELMERLYTEFQENKVDDAAALEKLRAALAGRGVLLLAPGSSLDSHRATVEAYIREKAPVVIGVNTVFDDYPLDYVFASNQKRMDKNLFWRREAMPQLLVTSNLHMPELEAFAPWVYNYASLTNAVPAIRENAGAMLLALLQRAGCRQVALAGFDGYSTDAAKEDYYKADLRISDSAQRRSERNTAMKAWLEDFGRKVDLQFVTPSVYGGNVV